MVKSSTPPSITSVTGGGLTFTQRLISNGSTDASLEMWTAPAASALSGVTLTVNYDATTNAIVLVAFGVNGSIGWDSNAGLPKTASTNSTPWTPSWQLTTDQSDDFIIYAAGGGTTLGSTPAAPTGFSSIDGSSIFGNFRFAALSVNYKTVTSIINDETYAASASGYGQDTGEAMLDVLTGGTTSSARPRIFLLA